MTDQPISYFFVGVGKCGTSWIYEFLRRRDIIATPSIKEPYLVDVDAARRSVLIGQLYAPKAGQPLGDFSNVYYWDPENAQKIKAINPDAKIIITTRLPSDRIVSHFGFLRRNGIVDEGQSISGYLDAGDSEDIVARSDYDQIIARYVAVFGADNVLILPLELLKTAPQTYADTLLTFMSQTPVTLSEQDKLPVLKAAKARSKMLARMAKGAANGLRRAGFLKMLGALKRQSLVRSVLYSTSVEKIVPDFGSAGETVQHYDDAYQVLLEKSGFGDLDLNGTS